MSERDTRLARMARVPGRVKPHGRFFYWACYRDLELATGEWAQMSMRNPDGAYAFPMEDGMTLVLAAPHRRLPEFRADLEGSHRRYLADLPDGPDLEGATRLSKLIGKLDLPNDPRPAARPGIAFVGDAALASDPFWGVGCGWAFQSADWLVEETAGAVADGGDVDAALERYRRRHRRNLLPHHLMITDTASGRQANAVERSLLRAAACDGSVAAAFEAVGSRREQPWTLLAPATLARIARAAVAA